MGERIVVGMSGGVDSAVAAALLKREGHEVIGIFMKNWEEKDDTGACTSDTDYEDVRKTCDWLDIPYYAVNFTQEYRQRVFDIFLKEYKRGRTPNPDVLCNREIKFKAFLDYAQRVGGAKLATGHYARVDQMDGQTRLIKGVDPGKDQSYFLYMLDSGALSQAMFPVGNLHKQQVRELARQMRLPVAEKKDSTGICFIGERDFKAFLMQYVKTEPGNMIDPLGNIVGKHDGLSFYTIGQRRGLGIGGAGERWFVIGKDMAQNQLLVQQGDGGALLSNACRADQLHFISGQAPGQTFTCMAKFRYRQADQKVAVSINEGGCTIHFDQPQRAVTPGQSVVFYQEDVCLGGGIIDVAW